MELQVIARIHNDFPEKFGLPRQSGLVEEVEGKIIFEKPFQNPDALRGLEGYDYIWLIWGFSKSQWKTDFSPTVRPPRLGGNKRMGVFATRSPYRPNPLGLSSVKLVKAELHGEQGPVLYVRGADLMDGTPIYDIKPYLPFADSHPDARGGFAQEVYGDKLEVCFPKELLDRVPKEKQNALFGVLRGDPRPSYQDDPQRIYGLFYAGMNIKFTVDHQNLKVISIEKQEKSQNDE